MNNQDVILAAVMTIPMMLLISVVYMMRFFPYRDISLVQGIIEMVVLNFIAGILVFALINS